MQTPNKQPNNDYELQNMNSLDKQRSEIATGTNKKNQDLNILDHSKPYVLYSSKSKATDNKQSGKKKLLEAMIAIPNMPKTYREYKSVE